MQWLTMVKNGLRYYRKGLFFLAGYLFIANSLFWLCAIIIKTFPSFIKGILTVFNNEIALNNQELTHYFTNSEQQFHRLALSIYAFLYILFLIGLIYLLNKQNQKRQNEQRIWFANGGNLASWLLFTTTELFSLLAIGCLGLFFIFYLFQPLIRQGIFELNYCFLHHLQQFSLKNFVTEHLSQKGYFQIKLPETNVGLWQLVKQQQQTTSRFQWIYLQNMLFINGSVLLLHLLLQLLNFKKIIRSLSSNKPV
ncbi:hypothetical protein [Enterococcus columbae]|uniref:Uncharacterized protein n=1 Tax=Enterococcus columbae DSM 7374 = ATCC 51263 TaxID=1121865 RepID=S0KRS8_9ENTE|nr:hypothetical protein [Enterococcus columbae]EOT41921.1 hypothetical protein OMW_01035 [Enterococcus columbae DSM 7374 = ATCC 51263]EOW80478.1 hypothetical protein I568_01655 [Enterococcus columbae DSM 7374 = ATCC 51263]OJG26445.1 hypothetical protein RR47_GL000193 [Enterococcus columbae DSM 7374 = ATCC 51263]